MVNAVRTIFYAATIALVGISPTKAMDVDGDPEKGAKLFKQCKACHQIGEGAVNRTGPHLDQVLGRVIGSVEKYRYSKVLKNARDAGENWNVENLSAYLENPRKARKGTKMSFRGFKKPEERANIIAYLATFSGTHEEDDHGIDPEILAIEGDVAYGEYLSGECTTCHQNSGADDGIPGIVGRPAQDFAIAMHQYKNGTREHPVMGMIAGRLSNDEIAALAAYFMGLAE